ncbi:MAG: hypothetical protein NT105_15540 [Verrucomicrobia bacterium]|nr:hypothetical protein [Verrucomicrobiota bacterium]
MDRISACYGRTERGPSSPDASLPCVHGGGGRGDDFKPHATVRDPKAMLDGYTSGQRVKVRVVAANKSGEARPSAEAEIVVG